MSKRPLKTKNTKKIKKKNWGLISLVLIIQVAIIAIIALVIYGFYLDKQIRDRIDGKVWELPAAVYGQVIELDSDSHYSKKEITTLLDSSQYQKVDQIVRPGEYTVQNDSIELYRRPFTFPDKAEPEVHVKFIFQNDKLTRIQNLQTKRDFGFFRIDPRLITLMQSVNDELRLYLPLNKFPELLVDTLLATEDRRFFEHGGVSLKSIARAFVVNLVEGRKAQGGSTLTQQLVKNLFLTNERSYERKLREIYMSIILERRYDKNRILELYLNEVFLGQDGDKEIRGFALASQFYFGRPVNELTLDQQALLVGMVKGASFYNPWRNPERALERRNVVLSTLKEQDIIDDELYTSLSQRPLGIQPKNGVLLPQPAFMQLVKKELQEKLGSNINSLSGSKIFTTFYPPAQDAAEKAIVEGAGALRKSRNKPDIEAAMVIVNRITGEIKAVVGGVNTQYAGFNRAVQSRRGIGSLAKPPTYLTALSQPDEYRLNTILPDEPLTISLPNGDTWSPRNIDKQYRGNVLLIDALAKSLNIPTVNLGMQLGLEQTAETLVQLGVSRDVIKQVPARFLGAIDMTLLEVAQMYQTLANNGNISKLSALRAVIGEKGETIYQSYPNSLSAISRQGSYLTMFALQQVVEQGTARAISAKYKQYHLAGKTGSTNDFRDSWFTGIDGKDVIVTWVGLDNFNPVGLSGSRGALPIYQRLLQYYPPQVLNLVMPADVNMMEINENGNFVCNNGKRQIPVWTTSPQTLCRESELFIRQQSHDQLGELIRQEEQSAPKNENKSFWQRLFD